jgi:hypothetical protein
VVRGYASATLGELRALAAVALRVGAPPGFPPWRAGMPVGPVSEAAEGLAEDG